MAPGQDRSKSVTTTTTQHQVLTLTGSSQKCRPGHQCVDLFKCKTVCTAVAEGKLSRDRALQDHLKMIHCGLGDQDTPLVCCERNQIAGEVYCGGRDIRQKMEEEFQRRENSEEEERGTCGLRKVFSFNIAGGENTNPGDWPWMARLIYSRHKEPSQLCGGDDNMYTYLCPSYLIQVTDRVTDIFKFGPSGFRTDPNFQLNFKLDQSKW